MNKPGFSKVLSNMADARADNNGNRLCPVEIASFDIVRADGPQAARVVLATNIDDYTAEEITAAFSDRNNRRVRLVPESVSKCATARGRNYYTAIALMNQQSLPFEEEHKKMKVLASSTFLDDDNQIWTVVGDGDTKRLVMNTDEDLTAVLASRKRYFPSTEFASASPRARNAHYVMFYSPAKGRMEFGFPVLTNKGVVLANRMDDVVQELDANLIVASAPLPDQKIFADVDTVVAAGATNKVLEYYRKLFADTTFFVRWEESLRKHGK